MNLHEYQSKQLFQQKNIPVPDGKLLSSADDITAIDQWLAGQPAIVKAQVHAGGRGKAGGVIKFRNKAELATAVEKLLGSQLITHQTGAEGLPVEKLYVEPLTDIASEFYLSLLVDRARKRVAVIASSAGGMSIEEVAAETPEKIFTEFVSPATGLQPYLARKLAFKLGLEGTQIRAFGDLLKRLYQLFLDIDASLIEINPLVTTTEGKLIALDAKINLDGSALYRHPDLAEMRDTNQEDEREVYAREHELNYIHLDGDIGCMVNGAGLAMATMDLIKLEGGQPANFLDVGGGTTAARVAEAFKLILSDEHVKAVLVNIFGGIVRCDLIAEGIIQAIEEVHVDVPVVVRLEGTKAKEGRQLLADSGLSIIPADDLAKAARQVVAAAREGEA
ncbi:MAG TPA: ADP-forming succinate--CoA ligase subunit beta [Chromatiales bacterium]|nr:ADP-forming succinate--CoA ligase subunit beta [Thiotrichales bacterium]HIP67826.1 ADP-forming succinate--CoA ligase subunit beta [Chromatiales bacterium]